jgi:DNA-binding MarR family transcriptional regulator
MKQKTSTNKTRLSELMFEMARLIKQQYASDGYGPSFYLHLETMRYLHESKAADMHDVAEYLRITAPSATGVVNALVKQGLVTRKPDTSDRRRVLLTVTAKGVGTLDEARERREAAFARVMEPLTLADRKELARILSVITKRA